MGAKVGLALFFGALLALLVLGFAVVQGIGAPSVPAGDVAIVQGAPASLSQVSIEKFEQVLRRLTHQQGIKGTPNPAESKALMVQTMEAVIPGVWLESEARDRDIEITPRQLAKALRVNREEGVFAEPAYPAAEIRGLVRRQLLADAIERELADQAAEPSSAEIEEFFEAERAAKFPGKALPEVRAEIKTILLGEHQTEKFHEFDLSFEEKWRARTSCASGYMTVQCGNYPGGRPLITPPECLEADPKKPAKECPAPVLQAQPALAGSITPINPEGEQLAQRPLPE